MTIEIVREINGGEDAELLDDKILAKEKARVNPHTNSVILRWDPSVPELVTFQGDPKKVDSAVVTTTHAPTGLDSVERYKITTRIDEFGNTQEEMGPIEVFIGEQINQERLVSSKAFFRWSKTASPRHSEAA